MAIDKYSRNYENLNTTELQIFIKHHDKKYTSTKYTTKEEMISALMRYVQNFETALNTKINYSHPGL